LRFTDPGAPPPQREAGDIVELGSSRRKLSHRRLDPGQVAAAAIFELARARIICGVDERGEQPACVVVHKICVRILDRPRQTAVLAQVDADERPGDAHELGRRHALAADVADAERDAAVG
jgi:hypothetical protein